jgi:PAS domain S-box-containing protein
MLAGVVPWLTSETAHILFGPTPHVNESIHEAVELIGSCIALGVALLLLLRSRYEAVGSHYFWVMAALIVMGLLHALHGVVEFGATWAWLRHSATLVGGILFGMVWIPLPRSVTLRSRKFVLAVTGFGLALALVACLSSRWLSVPWSVGGYSLPDKAANVVGGVGFIVAAVFFLRRFLREGYTEDWLFAGQTLLLGVAGLFFGFSHPWSVEWWAWHGFRLIAYAILLVAAYCVIVLLYRSLACHAQELEARVRERTAELQASEERLERAQQVSMVMVVHAGLDGRLLKLPPTFVAFLGYERESDLLGLSLRDVTHPDDFNADWPRCEALSRGEARSYEVEKRFVRRDGSVVWAYVNCSIVQDEQGNPVHFLNYVRDISDQKRLESERQVLFQAECDARAEAERLSRMKDEFLATVSHELRTPLTAIVGWSNLLLQDRTGDDRHAIQVIHRSAASLAAIVEDLLDTSRIITGKAVLKCESADLRALIDAAVDGVRIAAQAKRIQLHLSVDPDAGRIWCDPARFQQVIWNLLTNAIKFTPEEGQVSIAAVRDEGDIELRVVDTGKGISPEFLPRMFGRFQQEDSSTTRKYGGLGLGLAIVRHLVELHGGTIRAESKGEGMGSTFIVRVPRQSVEERLPNVGPASAADRPAVRPGVSDIVGSLVGVDVLVVDDDPETCRLVSWILNRAGACVRCAGSVVEGFAEFVREEPDIVLADLGMPEEDGYSLLRRIRSHSPHRDALCVALTAFARPEDRLRAIEAGFDEHLAKPFEPGTLAIVVAGMLERRWSNGKVGGAPGIPASSTPAHILVAEDSREVSQLLKMSLEAAGYCVSLADSVAGAVAVAEDRPVDVVLSDLRLPDGTGWELLTKVRACGTQAGRPVPGVMMSGYSDTTHIQQSEAAGFDAYFVKPVEDADLLSAVSRLLDRDQHEQSRACRSDH